MRPSVDLASSAESLAKAIRNGELTSEALVAASLERIASLDKRGPQYRSILSLNASALDEARALDAEAARGEFRGRLHGLPVLVKDTVETRELPTTAGSPALAANNTQRDAAVIAQLRSAGAIVLGKTNLSEWSNFRASDAPAGWSGLGGQTLNAVDRSVSPCGSSSGSAVTVALSFAPLAVGVETNGSITSPAACNGVVGLKPTIGLVSQAGIIPVSRSQDSAGPIARTVRDAALMLHAMVRPDATGQAVDYLAEIERGVEGIRVGVFRWAEGSDPEVSAAFNRALHALEARGAVLVDVTSFRPNPVTWESGEVLLDIEFKADLNTYLANAPDSVPIRSIDDLIAFNAEHATEDSFDQAILLQAVSAPSIESAEYRRIAPAIKAATGPQGIDALLKTHQVDLLVMPAAPPPSPLRGEEEDASDGGPIGASWLAAMAGYPALSVPMHTDADRLPLGMLMTATAGDDALLLRVGRALEVAMAQVAAEQPLTP
ncbi:MAG: amidase family protein [Pseudomonadota bacterium]